MKLPRNVTGRELVGALGRAFGYRLVHQVGSHVILEIDQPQHHRIAIPDHNPLRTGTLNGIIRAVAQAQGLSKVQVCNKLF